MNNQFIHIYDRQIALLTSGDPDRLIDINYTDDAELVGLGVHIVGAEALRTYFKGYIERLGRFKVISTDRYAEGSDSLAYEATFETANGIAKTYGAWVLRDDRICRQFTGLISLTPLPAP